MTQALNVLMAQINPVVGAVAANAEKILRIIHAQQEAHDIIVFPELALTGYPPEDLLLRPELFARVDQALEKIQASVRSCHVIIGHPCMEHGNRFNSASIFNEGLCLTRYHKQMLPNYAVFDEKRYFSAGKAEPCVFTVKGYLLGLCICEDLWQEGPVENLILAGAQTLICINASPFDYEKQKIREAILRKNAERGLATLYVNQIGGQDELVFDGQSMAMDSKGQICARAPVFVEDLRTVTITGTTLEGKVTPLLAKEPLIYQALMCGLRDYVDKNKFPGVILGLSGGIDSALTLAIAVDALGASRVHAVMMPSRYTANMSNEDAMLQITAMNVEHQTLPIEPVFNAFLSSLAPSFSGLPADITEENLQARIRGALLMALSNKTGNMVVTTSNKSETAVGYSTLYGDMAGGFAVLKDVLKTQVFALAKYRNSIAPVIPERVITRPPSAELAPNQTDQDSLPDYATLDAIIHCYMIENLSGDEIIARGYNAELVTHILKLIKRNEYKRRQSPPGVKISPCAYGPDWRYPITSGF